MRTVALVADAEVARRGGLETFEATVHGNPLPFAFIDVPRPAFRPTSPEHRDQVLIRVLAASCNYRDAGLMLRHRDLLERSGGNRFVHFGSDFTAVVEEVGAGVGGLQPGERVIPDATYPERGEPARSDGVPTNHATRGWLVMPAVKLRPIPRTVPATSAAVLGLNAQTAASMIRKAGIRAGHRVLVTAGRSNTSLSVLAQLEAIGAESTVLSSTPWTPAQRRGLGAPRVVLYEPAAHPFSTEPIESLAGIGPFDTVIDPFFDLFMLRVLPHLAHGGTYVTCGLKNQHLGQLADEREITHAVPVGELYRTMSELMLKNQRIVGNCIGVAQDLTTVVADLARGALTPVVDGVYPLAEAGAFLDRSFHDPERFGKVVLELEG